MRATKATEKNHLFKMIKKGGNKTMPPETGITFWARARLLPKEIPAKPGYFIDI
jgi:hypothetical protein